MMQVVRIEHRHDGLGLFHSHKPIDNVEGLTDLYSRHFNGSCCTDFKFPTPWNDGLNMCKDDKNWYCSFKNVQQIQSFIFPEELKIILSLGYNIWLLTVTDYQVGGYQVLYTKESIITSENINSIFQT